MPFCVPFSKSLDPAERGRKMPLPDARPSEKIAKLFPEREPMRDEQKDRKSGVKPADASTAPAHPATAVAQASTTQTAAAKAVPLPEARPNIKPSGAGRHRRHHRYYRRGR